MFGNRFSSSTSCSRWLHETEADRLDQAFSGRFLKVATHPDKALTRAIARAAETVSVRVLDYLIVSAHESFSFRKAGLF